MAKYTCIISILFLFVIELKAQNENTIGLSFGVNNGLLKDLNFSRLHYKESGHLFSLQFLRYSIKRKDIIEIGMDFCSGKIKTDVSTFLTANSIYGKIRASYYLHIRAFKSNKWNIYAGAGYATNLLYFEWDDNEAFSYLATHGLTLNFKVNYIINKRNQIISTISVPFLQVLARPPYNGRNEFIIENENSPAKIFLDGKLVTFNHYYGFSWTTKYIFNVSKLIDLSVNYNLNHQKTTGVNKLIHLQHQVQAGININF